mmetsp:Transcript_16342/g.50725  ORF Transcript_16342/g.50725 Transcript_16342/m.50725 type:complete len:260 (-) Transcript_16342:1341-2120(-)
MFSKTSTTPASPAATKTRMKRLYVLMVGAMWRRRMSSMKKPARFTSLHAAHTSMMMPYDTVSGATTHDGLVISSYNLFASSSRLVRSAALSIKLYESWFGFTDRPSVSCLSFTKVSCTRGSQHSARTLMRALKSSVSGVMPSWRHSSKRSKARCFSALVAHTSMSRMKMSRFGRIPFCFILAKSSNALAGSSMRWHPWMTVAYVSMVDRTPTAPMRSACMLSALGSAPPPPVCADSWIACSSMRSSSGKSGVMPGSVEM